MTTDRIKDHFDSPSVILEQALYRLNRLWNGPLLQSATQRREAIHYLRKLANRLERDERACPSITATGTNPRSSTWEVTRGE